MQSGDGNLGYAALQKPSVEELSLKTPVVHLWTAGGGAGGGAGGSGGERAVGLSIKEKK